MKLWKPSTYIILLLALALLIGAYELLRYSGHIGEGDTSVFSGLIAGMLGSGKLIPPEGAYQNGYGYQALVSWLVTFTAVPLGVIQVVGGALLLFWVIVPAWLAYREFTHSELAASLGCLILLVQPDFLFPLLRGTHEKFTRGLMFLSMYLLLRSIRSRSLKLTVLLIACFYLSTYALISFNTFYSFSFTLVIILALGLVWLSDRRLARNSGEVAHLIPKLFTVTFSLLVVAFVFIVHAYPPAQNQLRILQSVWDRLAMLTLMVEQTATNPYQVFSTGWISLPVYYLVSIANWLLLASSLLLWLRSSWIWLIKRRETPNWYDLTLWAFYAAFAFLAAVSIIVDVSGALASNLQHRSFPSFAMLAAPLVGKWLSSVRITTTLRHRLTWGSLSVAFAGLMLLSLFKATNEPLLSNYWSFYTPAEYRSVQWAERKLTGGSLWVGYWAPVSPGYVTMNDGRLLNIELDAFAPSIFTHDFLLSSQIKLYSLRSGTQLPLPVDGLVTYDNGEVQVYHARPHTPFQK